MARALALLLASPLLVACGGPSPARPSAPVAAVAPAAGEAPDALAARGEYAAAAERYRAGLRARPDDLMLHFALGSVLSYLDEPEETRAEFRWVVAHGSPGRPEVATARQWLAAAERLERPASRPRPPTATPVEVRRAPNTTDQARTPVTCTVPSTSSVRIVSVCQAPSLSRP